MKAHVSGFRKPTLGEFLAKFIPRKTNKQKGVYSYGSDNKLPQEIIQLAATCADLLKALRKRSDYVVSNGFIDNGDFVIDENGKTANTLLAEIAFQRCLFGSVDLYIKRTGGGKIFAEPTAHELIRRRLDGNFDINPKWGQSDFKESETVIYPAFAPDRSNFNKFTDKEGNVLGEIVYYWRKDAISFHYPIPDWFAGEMDVRTSAELSSMDLEMAVNSFMTSGVLTLIGDVDNEKDDGSYTYFDQVKSLLTQFTGGVKNSDGTSDRMRMLLLTAPTKDEVPILQSFPVDKLIEGSIQKREAIGRTIAMNAGVNPVLLGYDAATTLGNTQAIANASNELANSVVTEQEDICHVFEMLWPEKEWKISKFSPVTFIPAEVWAKMTDDEIRAAAGLDPLQVEIPTDSDKVLQKLSTMSPLVSAEIIKRMDDDTLFELIGLK